MSLLVDWPTVESTAGRRATGEGGPGGTEGDRCGRASQSPPRRTAVKTARQRRSGRGGARPSGARTGCATAWRVFDQVRDGVAASVRRRPTGTTWWTPGGCCTTGPPRPRANALGHATPHSWRRQAALAAIDERVSRLGELFRRAGVARSAGSRDDGLGTDPAGYRQAAALAVERATAAHERVVERRAQAARLGEQAASTSGRRRWPSRWPCTCGPTGSSAGCSPRRWTRWSPARRGSCASCPAGSTTWPTTRASSSSSTTPTPACARGVRTLSGGETFQASLALALALSEQLAGLSTASASLESIMLDEGFGTLDAGTLDTVAATLENLAARGDRMVGVVTHVAALAERIPVRFEVSRDARGAAHIVRAA